ncbi:MAG: hypothetical protein FJZ90_09730 [Chloroflexi bacterium]|nr:hypothetical protein [Chloroflexota bacterium]
MGEKLRRDEGRGAEQDHVQLTLGHPFQARGHGGAGMGRDVPRPERLRDDMEPPRPSAVVPDAAIVLQR